MDSDSISGYRPSGAFKSVSLVSAMAFKSFSCCSCVSDFDNNFDNALYGCYPSIAFIEIHHRGDVEETTRS